MSLMSELKRRKVFQVGAAYLVVAWLLIQIVATVAPQLQLPEWAPRLVTLFLMVGFPIALVIAWVFEVTPEGVKVDAAKSGSKRMYAFAAALAAAAIAWYFLAPGKEEKGTEGIKVASTAVGNPATVDATLIPSVPFSSSSSTPAKQSIAVLAFADLSPGKDQEYFSDGMAEEILNALVKVKGLKVAGRTASFYYKGRNEKLKTIGEELGVAHVLEGSVRKQGDKVRITAQLIQAADGFHLWSETYDGDLSDVFELQEQIARAITTQMEVVLAGGNEQRLVPVATTNPEAYTLYLKATDIIGRRDGARFSEAIALLGQALRLDPGYARAQARLASVHVLSYNFVATDVERSLVAAEDAATKATALDPGLAEPFAVLGLVHLHHRQWAQARAGLDRALALEPGDPTANFWDAVALKVFGYNEQATRALDRTLALDPLPNALAWRSRSYLDTGDLDAAEHLMQRAAESGLAVVGLTRSNVLAARGRHDDAVVELARALAKLAGRFPADDPSMLARACLGDAAAKAQALASIDAYLAGDPAVVDGIVPYILLRIGEVARGLELLARRRTTNDALVFLHTIWSRESHVPADPAFPGFAREIGLAQWWDRNGAPDRCRKGANGEYACE